VVRGRKLEEAEKLHSLYSLQNNIILKYIEDCIRLQIPCGVLLPYSEVSNYMK
jgi:hypothetical protein